LRISVSGIIIGLISICVGIFLLFGAWEACLDYNHIQEYSGRASGHVTKKHFQTAADGIGNYYLDYSFTSSDGIKIIASNNISKQQWDALQVNDNLEIKYDPVNPNRSMPIYGSNPSLVFAFFIFILGVVFLAFGVSRFISIFRKGHK
jgi:hypothetical protein